MWFPPAGQLEIAQADGVDFGFQALHTSATRRIAISNPGPNPTTIHSVIPPAGFTAGNTCGTIAVGAACTLDVGFTPTTSKNFAGLLTIDSTSPAGPHVVALKGIGFDPDGNLALGRESRRLLIGARETAHGRVPGQARPPAAAETVKIDETGSFSVDLARIRSTWASASSSVRRAEGHWSDRPAMTAAHGVPPRGSHPIRLALTQGEC